MNTEASSEEKETRLRKRSAAAYSGKWLSGAEFALAAIVTSLVVLIYSALATAPQPVLKITPLGSNQFNITITNGVSTTNYTLFWTPAVADTNYPWIALWGGDVGQTNFAVNGLDWPLGFFKVMIGHDLDGDSWPVWQDVNDNNASVGILSITIDSPTNGFSFN